MIILTEAARTMLKQARVPEPVNVYRITYQDSGCHCSGKLLALDHGKPRSLTGFTAYPAEGYTFYVETKVMAQAGSITIDGVGGIPYLTAKNSLIGL